jgi:hypothetical protein
VRATRPAARQSRKRCGIISNVSEETSRTQQHIRRAESHEARTRAGEKRLDDRSVATYEWERPSQYRDVVVFDSQSVLKSETRVLWG